MDNRFIISGLGVVGALIGVGSAVYAITITSGDPAYQVRIGFGVGALMLAVVIGVVAMLRMQPGATAAIYLLGGAVGCVAINLFYINTLYVAALPFWIAGAVVALVAALRHQTV